MDIWVDVDAAITVPVNLMPLIDDTDFKTREIGIVYNQAGMDLVWNFQTTAGVTSQVAVTPTTAGDYDWTHSGDGMYKIEIPASGGASINNDTEGFGWFSGICTGVLAWRGPVIGFRAAALNNALIDGGDILDVNPTELGGDAQSLIDLKDFADAGYDPATNKVQGVVLADTVTGVTNDVGITQAGADKVWGSVARTLTSFGTLIADFWAFATRILTANTNLNDPTKEEIADQVWDEAISGHVGAGSFGAKNQKVVPSETIGDYKADVSGVATSAALTSHDNKLAPVALDGGGATIGGMLTKMADDSAGASFDATSDSLEAIRDRGDAAWITGGGGGITDILNIIPLIPSSIDLANTATVRLALRLVNSLDDLPSTAEITPGTISIERKAIGGTSWSAVVTDAACLEIAGQIYYDEVFDSGAGYAEGDSLRITFKSQKITVAANDYEVFGATGAMFHTEIRQTMRGTDSAALASGLAAHDGKLDTAQLDLDTLTGADGVTLATAQANYAPSKAGDDMNLADDAITPPKFSDAALHIMYAGGIWVDDAASNTNTVPGVDGLESNPVSTLVAARTLADAIGVKKYYITNDSTLTLAATHLNWEFVGKGLRNQLNMGSQNVNDSHFFNLVLSGTQGGTQKIQVHTCYLNGITDLNCISEFCWLTGTNTLAVDTQMIFDHWSSNVPGASTPVIVFQAGVTTVGFRHGSGGLEFQQGTSDHTVSVEGRGQLVINANCTSMNISVRGCIGPVTDNGTTTNLTTVAVYNQQQIADALKLAPTAGSPAAGSVNKDLDDILEDTNELQTDWVNGGRLDLILDAIKAVTDLLPDAGALSDLNILVTRLTAARAGYLDELGAANLPSDIDTLLSRLSAARAGYLDNLSAGTVALEATLTAMKGGGWSTETLVTIEAALLVIKAKTDNLPEGIKINTAHNNFMFWMVDSTDHITGKTGLVVTAQRAIDSGAFGACANSVSEVALGWYRINWAASDLNGVNIAFSFTASGADARELMIKTTT